MANNIAVLDGAGVTQTVKTTDNAGVHTPHHNIDGTVTVTGSGGTFPVTDSGGSLTVDNAGTFAVQVDGAGLTALQLIDDVVLAEDAAHGSGDKGVMALAVRHDAGGTLAGTTGDYAPLQLDSSGALRVTGGGGGTQYAVDAALGSTPTGTLAVAIRDDALSSLTPVEGDAIGLRVDANGALWVIPSGTTVVGDGGGSLTVDGTVAATQSGTWNITNISGTVSLPTGAATAAKQPALGTAGTASADVITVQGIASMTALKVDGSAVTQPVSGTFWQATQPVSAASLPLPTGASTLAEQQTQTTALQLIDDSVLAVDAVGTGGKVVLAGAIRDDALSALTPAENDAVNLRTDANGALWVIPSGTVTIAGNVTNAGTFAVQAAQSGTWNVGTVTTVTTCSTVTSLSQFGGQAINLGNGTVGTGTLRVTLASDSTGQVALAAGTNAIGKLTANAGVTIGAVELAAAQTLATVTTVNTLTGGGIAHDSADSGNPHKLGAKATTALSGLTLVASGDRTDLFAGVDGVLITRPHCNLEDQVQERVTNTDGASTAFAAGFAAPGAGVRLYLTSLVIANSSSSNCTVDIRDGSAGSVLLTVPVPANSGVIFNPPVPLKFSVNTAAAYDASAAISTLSITAIGFKSKV